MVFGIFKDYTKIAAEEINREFDEFEKLLNSKKNKITAQDFKKKYSKKLFFRKVKCDMGIRSQICLKRDMLTNSSHKIFELIFFDKKIFYI